ncbi:MAG: roadblock/LC7 domain-containing protein [Myxococcota bacterium]|nr:roadblock/LC7 domain-containing protein [Myxococcota bacterium]
MFTDKLKSAVDSVKGGEAAIIMGYDGIPVDHFEADKDVDIETVGMEFSVVLKEVKKAAELLETGSTEEMTVRTEMRTTILRVVNDSYFLAFVVRADGNMGKARYVLRMLAPELKEDLT